MELKKILERIDEFLFRLREMFLFPICDFVLDNFNWIQVEGQMFNLENGDILIQWNGECDKSRSVVSVNDRSLYRQFENLPDGTVFFCDRIWGVDGTLRKIRYVEVAIRGDEIDSFTEDDYPLDPCFYKLRDNVETYKNRMVGIMSEICKTP